jgi:hypothetical protein
VKPHQIWLDQCEAAREIAAEFGVDRAITYLVGEKFINFVSAAETEKEFREELPAFAAEIRDIFERWQLAAYLEVARQTERFDPADYDDPAEAEVARRQELRESANDLLLVERAREWLLEE